MHKYVNQEHHKKKPQSRVLSQGELHRWQMTTFGGFGKSEILIHPVGINSFCWFVSAAAEMDSDNWGWCWLNMKGSSVLDWYYLVRIQGYTVFIHFRLSAVCLFQDKVMLGIFIRTLQTCAVCLDKTPARTASHSTLLCVSHLIVFPSFTSTPHIFAAVNIRPPSVW